MIYHVQYQHKIVQLDPNRVFFVTANTRIHQGQEYSVMNRGRQDTRIAKCPGAFVIIQVVYSESSRHPEKR